MSKRQPYPEKRPAKLPGNLWQNNGYWYWRVRLPNAEKRKDYPLKPPGGKATMSASLPRDVAEAAAWRMWDSAESGVQPAGSGRRRNLRKLADEYYPELERHYTPRGHDKPTTQAGVHRRAIEDLLINREHERPEVVTGAVVGELVRRWINRGLTRTTINKYLSGLARFYEWLLAQSYIDAYTEAAVGRFPHLAEHRTNAAESEPVKPVAPEVVQALLPRLTPTLADMVRVQYICDMRPGEVCRLSASQINREHDIWLYEPTRHKTQHKGKPRIIAILPEARPIIEARMARRKPDEPLFSARESYIEHLERQHAARKTPMSCGNVPTKNPIIRAGNEYQPKAYGHRIHMQSIALAAELWQKQHGGPPPTDPDAPSKPKRKKSGPGRPLNRIPQQNRKASKADRERWALWQAHLDHWSWTPNQLRHTAASANRAIAGKEIAAILLGHTEGSNATDIYTQTVIVDEERERVRQQVREAARIIEQAKGGPELKHR